MVDKHTHAISPRKEPEHFDHQCSVSFIIRKRGLSDEARKRNVIIHRCIAAVGGSTYCDFQELKEMARMANEEKIEMIMTVGHRKGWDAGSKEISTPEGAMQGFRLRGSDNISYHIADIMRNIEAGHRGFLVYDEGVLFILNKMRVEVRL